MNSYTLNNNISEMFDQVMSENINQGINKVNNNPTKNVNQKPILKSPLIKKIDTNYLDLSKKAIIGSIIYILLSLPYLSIIFDKIITNNTTLNFYKLVIIKSIIFSIIFVIVGKYI